MSYLIDKFNAIKEDKLFDPSKGILKKKDGFYAFDVEDHKAEIVEFLESNSYEYYCDEDEITLKSSEDEDIYDFATFIETTKKPRNPFSQAAVNMSKTSGGAHADSKNDNKNDKLSRSAKHKGKNRFYEKMVEYKEGDTVSYNKTPSTVKIPKGPNNTIGIEHNGVLTMISENELDDNFDNLSRMKQLAGIGSIDTVSDDVVDFDVTTDVVEPVEDEIVMEPIAIISEEESEAAQSITMMTDEIRSLIPELKISEYKHILVMIDDLASYISRTGRDYLGD